MIPPVLAVLTLILWGFPGFLHELMLFLGFPGFLKESQGSTLVSDVRSEDFPGKYPVSDVRSDDSSGKYPVLDVRE